MRATMGWCGVMLIVVLLGAAAAPTPPPAAPAPQAAQAVPPAAAAASATADTGVSIVASSGDGARYWPRWRGPSGQGEAPGSGYPDRWSVDENE